MGQQITNKVEINSLLAYFNIENSAKNREMIHHKRTICYRSCSTIAQLEPYVVNSDLSIIISDLLSAKSSTSSRSK